MRTFRYKYFNTVDNERYTSECISYKKARQRHSEQGENYLRHFLVINSYKKAPYKKNKRKAIR